MRPLQLIACCLAAVAAMLAAGIAIGAIVGRLPRFGRGRPLTSSDGWFMLCGAVFFGCQAVSTGLDYTGALAITATVIGFVAAVPWLAHQAMSLRTPPVEPPRPMRE